MNRSVAIVASMLAVGAAGAALAGCTGSHPFVRDGTANSVEVGYSGDVASAWAVARQYCAQFDRAPRLVDPGFDLAVFDCVRR